MRFLDRLNAWRRRLAPHGRPAAASAPATAPLAAPDEAAAFDTGRPMRLGLRTLGLGLGGFLLWATLAPLDEGVPTPGTVAIDTKRKSVQHLSGGIVRAVHVREGQRVEAGQLLIQLEAAAVYAGYQTIRQQYLSLRATESRLLAEQGGQGGITFHPDLLALADEPGVRQLLDNQIRLFQARRAALQSELAGLAQSIGGQQGVLNGLDAAQPQRQQQMALLRQELEGIRELVGEGYVPLNRQRELERQLAELSAGFADLQGNQTRTRGTIAELHARRLQRSQEYQKEVNDALAEVRRQVQADADKLRAATEELERTDIRAPVAGQVVGLAMQTVGGVIQASQKLMDIVPVDEGLILEAHVPPHLIDRVQPGQATDIHFANFAHSPQLVVSGQVDSLSTDLLSEPGPGGQPVAYYLARVSVTADGRRTLGGRLLQAGMPAEVIIRTGERSLLAYWLHPLLKRFASALKEA